VRDLLVLALVICAIPFAIRHTWIGVLLWNWLSIMNPHKLAFGFAYDAPFAAVAAITTVLSLFLTRDKLRMTWRSPVSILVVFVMWMCLTTAVSVSPELAWPQLNKVLKIQFMTLIAIAALQDRKHIELFIWVNALSVAFFGVKGGIWTILHGGGERVWGPPGGFIEGNNELGVALVMVIPLLNFLRAVSTNRWIRHGLLGVMLLCAVSALGTQSRGALLAITAMGLMLWVRSPRKLVTGIAVAVVATALLSFMPSTWEDRMNTMQSYEEDGSAVARIESWKFVINLANHKFFGGGFDAYTPANYAIYNPESLLPQVAHSIYFSVLGEHGYIGLLIFLILWATTFRMFGSLREASKKRPETNWLYHLTGMCQVALVGYAVGGAFLSLAYFDVAYNLIVVLVVSRRWLESRGWERETHGAFGSASTISATPPLPAVPRRT
jgi:putative inorganic carbon (hco3(-)) transporter